MAAIPIPNFTPLPLATITNEADPNCNEVIAYCGQVSAFTSAVLPIWAVMNPGQPSLGGHYPTIHKLVPMQQLAWHNWQNCTLMPKLSSMHMPLHLLQPLLQVLLLYLHAIIYCIFPQFSYEPPITCDTLQYTSMCLQHL